MCQHPNIAKLVDLFENSGYYFIVLEYLAGGDMFDYLEEKKFKIGETRAKVLGL